MPYNQCPTPNTPAQIPIPLLNLEKPPDPRDLQQPCIQHNACLSAGSLCCIIKT
jgi:hypothetical protein